MATAADRHQPDDIAPAETAAAGGVVAPVQKRRGSWIKRMMYSPMATVAENEKGASAAAAAAYDGATRTATKPRRGGWLRRLAAPPREHALMGSRRRQKLGGGGGGVASRLLAGLPRWKRLSVGGGCASALLDAAAFRVMYVVEAVVLGLALSCFFCCCGCQI